MTVKLKGTFKKDARVFNGLESIAAELVKHPHERRVAVVVLETARITDNVEDGGSREITVRLVHIEPLIAPLAVMDARKLLEDAYRERTADTNPLPQDTLPFGETAPDDQDHDGADDNPDGEDPDGDDEGDDEDPVPPAQFLSP